MNDAGLRERIKQRLNVLGKSARRASLDSHMGETAIKDILRRPQNSPSVETLRKLAIGLETSTAWLLHGTDDQIVNAAPPRMAKVAGIVQAGLWYDDSIPPQVDDDPIPYVPTRFAMQDQLAYRVVGPSMNERGINDGDYVLCVPYFEVRTGAQDGDLVIVERSRDNGEVERTVKEVVVEKHAIKLMPRSSDPAYREPIVIPRNLNVDSFERVEIIALVIGAYRSFF